MPTASPDQIFAELPKAELHVHLEGSVEPGTMVELASRHGVSITLEEAVARYAPGDFLQFIESYKWVVSFLRGPDDYALIARRFAESLRRQNVVYAEVTLSIGIMYRARQNPTANFAALRDAASSVPGIRIVWIFDAVRQWGSDAAMEVARLAVQLRSLDYGSDIVAFGIGGDECSVPTHEFKRIYDFVAAEGLRRLIHAGEIGGPESVREAVEILGVERIGHGIAVMRDERVMDLIATRGVTLEVCPTSNLRTGALATQLGIEIADYQKHPLPLFCRRGLQVTLSSDDPAMFETTLHQEYVVARQMGLNSYELLQLAESSFQCSFLPREEKQALLQQFRSGAMSLGLL